MSGVPQSDPSGQPLEPRPSGERAWQHPSEVGMANRGRSDRRRSAVLAAGVVISGLGLLVSGVFLGSADRNDVDAAPEMPFDTVASSVAHVTVVRESGTSVVTGLVLDDAGHVLVPADSVAESDEIWARCAAGASELVGVVGVDPESNLAILRLGVPAGTAANASTALPQAGVEVVTVHARGGVGMAMRTGTIASTGAASAATDPTRISPTADLFWAEVSDRPVGGRAPATTDLSGGMMFDESGRFVGMTTTAGTATGNPSGSRPTASASLVEVMPAEAALSVAERIIASG